MVGGWSRFTEEDQQQLITPEPYIVSDFAYGKLAFASAVSSTPSKY